MVAEPTHRGLFFDRDGTLNEEVGHMTDLARLQLIDGAEQAVGLARDAGWRTAIITNQGAIARGIADEGSVREANRLVAEAVGGVDGIYYCPHHPTEGRGELRIVCDCRKPEPGLLLRAARDLGVDLSTSYYVGDSERDLRAARGAGCGAVLVLTGHDRETIDAMTGERDMYDHVAADVLAAVEWVLTQTPGSGR